jgi:hypothetical protein
MSVIATLDVAAEDFVLEAAIAEPSGLRVQLERVVTRRLRDAWHPHRPNGGSRTVGNCRGVPP